jgi:hypothetical protein
MKNSILAAVIVVLLGGGIAAYLYWQDNQPKPVPVKVQVPAPPLPAPKPEMHQVIEPPPSSPPLPALANSDDFMLDALTGLIGDKSLIRFFHAEKIIHNIVATIINLTSNRAPMSVMPVEQAPGVFLAAGKEEDMIISPKNAARYTLYAKIAETINAKKLVEAYVGLYPLFQQAYEELGYPKKYFNDQLIETLDNLLDSPVIKEPIKLVQPNVLYQFADPDLESRSIGQRILMRTGSKNESVFKSKLREIKQELKLHTHEIEVERAG